MSYSIIVTLIMLLAIIFLLLKNVSSPGVIFTFVPIAAAICMGFEMGEIGRFVGDGLKTVSGTLFLMVITVLYFGILHEAGVFKALVSFVLKLLGNSVLGTMMVTAAVSFLTQLDGSGATTALCTISALRPIYEQQKIRREALLLIESLGSGVFCLLPWAPAIVEASAYVNLDVNEVFRFLVPLLVFCIVLVFAFCIPAAIAEKKHGAGISREEFLELKKKLDTEMEFPFGRNIALIDGLLTLAVMGLILAGLVPTNVAFAISYPVLLMLNYRKPEQQREYFKRQAPTALNLAFTMLGIGVLVGVNNGTGALAELAVWISEHAPESIISHLPLILCVLSLPLTITVGNTKNAIIVPAVVSILAPMGFEPIRIMAPVFACGVIAANVSLFNATPYLALGLADVDIRSHLKYSLLPVYGFSLLMMLFMIITGMLPL